MALRSFSILTTIVGLGDLSGAQDQQIQSVLLPAITHTSGPPEADQETTASLTSSSTRFNDICFASLDLTNPFAAMKDLHDQFSTFLLQVVTNPTVRQGQFGQSDRPPPFLDALPTFGRAGKPILVPHCPAPVKGACQRTFPDFTFQLI